MIRQCFILFGCLAAGELIIRLTGLPLPSSIIGMLILTTLLELKFIQLEWIEGLSNFLVSNLGFFFVPSGVAIMKYYKLISNELVPILVATFVSTVLVLVVTGWVHQIIDRYGFFRK